MVTKLLASHCLKHSINMSDNLTASWSLLSWTVMVPSKSVKKYDLGVRLQGLWIWHDWELRVKLDTTLTPVQVLQDINGVCE